MFKKILIITTSVLILATIAGFLYFYMGYRIINCGKDELAFESPANQWVKISCYDGNHIITSAGNYRWEKSGKKVFLNARGYLDVIIEKNIFNDFSVESISNEGTLLARGAFNKPSLENLVDYAVDNLNKDLSDEIDINTIYDTVYHLRIFSSAGFPYDLFMYIKDSKPEYIYACINYCHVYPPEIIKVVALK